MPLLGSVLGVARKITRNNVVTLLFISRESETRFYQENTRNNIVHSHLSAERPSHNQEMTWGDCQCIIGLYECLYARYHIHSTE